MISHAQCCAAGNPVCDDGTPGSSGKNLLEISLLYQYSFSDVYYEGNNISDYEYIDNSHYNFLSLNIKYGITKRLKALADIGYYIDKAQSFTFGHFERNGYGLGDGSLGLQYSLLNSSNNLFNIYPSFRMVFPIGQFDQKDGVVVLPIDIQPSSGSFKYNMGITFSRRFKNSKFALFSSNTLEISQRINTERTNYKYGNLYNFSISGSYKHNTNFSGRMIVRYMLRERASDYKNEKINATGGKVLYVTPQISYTFFDNWNTSVSWEQPVYKYMNGIQLTNKWAILVKVSRAINLGRKRATPPSLSELEKLQSVSFKVNGICGMCKDRIEKTVLRNNDVKYAEWNIENKVLTIKYRNQPDMGKLKESLAKTGHDTDTHKASDKAYAKLHACCKYRFL